MITTILPTDKCNLNCSYCISRKGNNEMSMKTLYNAVDFVSGVHKAEGNNGHIEWHAAEPMMMPISFYEAAEERFKYNNCNVERMLCSNMTLANEEWFDFIKKHNYAISTSLDGDIFITDEICGKGTFEKIIKSFSRMRELGIGFGVICVISKYSCLHADEIYPFFKHALPKIKINIVTPNTFQKETTAAFIKIFDDWFSDENKIMVDPFDDMVNFIEGEHFEKRCYVDCNKFVVCVDSFGNVYPCESFVIDDDTSEYILGNVNEQPWQEIWTGEKRKAFLKNQAVLSDECFCCRYLEYCGGGCNADSMLYGPKDTRKASCCEVIKPLMDHIASKIGAS